MSQHTVLYYPLPISLDGLSHGRSWGFPKPGHQWEEIESEPEEQQEPEEPDWRQWAAAYGEEAE